MSTNVHCYDRHFLEALIKWVFFVMQQRQEWMQLLLQEHWDEGMGAAKKLEKMQASGRRSAR
jgi:hypothetical protein